MAETMNQTTEKPEEENPAVEDQKNTDTPTVEELMAQLAS